MAYLEFNKEELVNLEYSLEREILLSNRAGGYVNTTIVGCNTRKYHGLLVVPIENFGGDKHILLSTLHESLIQHGQSFNLGITSYGDVYEPRGHKYIIDFEMDYASTITYRVGGMKFSKTIMFLRDTEEVLVKYTLLEAHSPTTLRIKPFLAYRNIHALTSANTGANTRYTAVDNGVAFNMYEGFPTLNLQLNKKNDWIASPDWYKGIVYKEESRRGFECKEDLFVPGYFELPIKKGESIILSASTGAAVPSKSLKTRFDKEVLKRDNTRSNYDACDSERQKHLLYSFRNTLLDSGKYVSASIDKITSQTYMLTINDAMDTNLRSIISDFRFEFEALCTDLSSDKYEEYFWDHMEAITKDLNNYIAAWTDISFYNSIEFQPYKFMDVAKYEFAKED